MRVICRDIEELTESLTAALADGGTLFERAVRISVSRNAKNEHVAQITIHVGAVVCAPDGQYLVEYAEQCGLDCTDGKADLAGSDKATQRRQSMQDWCGQHGCRILPGLIDY